MSNFRFWAGYLLHKFTAKNRHGLHSPFVYRLVDEVIYDFSDKKEYQQIDAERKRLLNDRSHTASGIIKQQKSVRLIYRLIADRLPKTIVEVGAGREVSRLYAQVLSAEIKFYTPESYPSGTDMDVIWISDSDIMKHFEWSLPKVGEDTMMMVSDIHLNNDMKQAWATIKANPRVIATVDLFWIGLVYFRKGQVKEDFRIKF